MKWIGFWIVAACALAGSPALAQFQSTTEATGRATTYILQMTKFELCTDVDSSGGGCEGAFVVGSGAKSFDIASVSVGQSVGSYASNISLPVGTTYKYVRFTISRTFTISGTVSGVENIIGGATVCRTGGADATGYTLATAAVGLAGTGTASAQVVKLPDVGTWGGGYPNYPTSVHNPYGSPAVSLAGNSMTVTWALSQPYTVTSAPPTITLAFDTATALGAGSSAASNGSCIMGPQPPSVTITIK